MHKMIKCAGRFILLAFCILFCKSIFGANVDTVSIYSKAMKKYSRCVVITPFSSFNKGNQYPVVYLLHGYSGNYANWIMRDPELKNYADAIQLIIVCPDGNYNSWYIDSPVDSNIRYDTYISTEVPQFIDSAYPSMPSPGNRAITGLSMGGHGALSIALRHPDIFGAAGSMSGVLWLTPWKNNYELKNLLREDNAYNDFENYSVLNLIDKNVNIAITIDCGVDDPFISANKKVHERLMNFKIPHDYTERYGGHTWEYWRNALPYQLLFFHRFFSGNLGKKS